MVFVYLLWHTHYDESLSGGEDVKLIGVYSTETKAEEALLRAKQLDGFKDFHEGFEISVNVLDKDEWTSGFITNYS
ncbi:MULTISPECIES: hypothetical protein [unclassified Pedobacter]|uniref:DUF7336 domain-containing protein n=1 Tax=unclassified Pedobacter TaxID=2628915 RepID=UPI001420F416|nr:MULTISPECIES: hypothetical protein [unclassified Pedobacter]NII85340.1 hypothetical protein [Pedobacter sp. SG908]NMN39745.1 hypothetical protein [Pedobacter sp. SG918]